MGYSPIIGRFLQRDPEEYTEGLNLYQYELSNPVNRVDPQGTDSTPTTQPSSPTVAQLAQQQLAMLQAIGKKFAQQDANWSWSNQCDLQAADLYGALLNDKQWMNTKPQLWEIGTTGGTGSLRFGRHNLVTLTPKGGNPLPPMTLDSFHGPQHPLSDRDCKCGKLSDFKKEYPAPVDADSWWLVVLKHLPKMEDP
jgi:hypothetical protein